MKSKRLSFFLSATAFALAWLAQARAMSVLPPNFDELVDESSQIVRGKVLSSEALNTTTANGTPVIKTRVTWQLESALKGSTATTLTLEFLGGTVGSRTMTVSGMPQFKVGERGYVFVGSNPHAACPLVAAGFGHYRLVNDETGQLHVARHDGTPLVSLAEVKAPLNETELSLSPASHAAALTADAFEAAITSRIVATRQASTH